MNDTSISGGLLSDAALDRLIAAAARNPLALARLARQLMDRGDRGRSIDLAHRALDLPSDRDGEAHELAAWVLSSGVPPWHFALVLDEVRNAAYEAALRRACGSGARVLDIGSGTGLLAMLAARAGAREVISCEMNLPVARAAEEIVRKNGFGHQIRVVPKKSTDLDLAEDLRGPVDVIVSEIVSNNLLGEAPLPAMQDAVERLLVRGGRVIPARGQIRLALAHYARPDQGRMGHASGFDLRPFNRLATPCRRLHVGDRHLSLRSEPVTLFDFDFESGGPHPDRKRSLELTAAGGPVNGMVQWIRLELDEHQAYENLPSPGASSCWSPMFYQFDREIEIDPGASITVHAAHGLTTLRIWTTAPAYGAGR
jgi:type III protein arginine methyltransferase